MWPLPDRLPRAEPAARIECVIGDFPVCVQSDLADVLDDFRALYPARASNAGAKPPTIQVEVRRAGWSRSGRRLYGVLADGQPIGGLRARNGVFPLVEWGINLRVMETRDEYLQFHAASLSHHGRGFVFAGDSGCGKSTLAATLTARGWRYFCDEFALVDPRTLRLHPFPKAICIKTGSYGLVRELGWRFARRCDYVKALKGRVGYLNPRAAGSGEIAQPTAIRGIVFPRYSPGTSPALRRIPRSVAALRLFRQSFNHDRFPDSAVPIIVRLVEKAECFELDVGAPRETTRLLEECLDGGLSAVAQAPRNQPPRPEEGRRAAPRGDARHTRRHILKVGAKVAYVAPVVFTLSARQVFAAASNPSGICSTAKSTGELCETDADCCSQVCNLGLCN
ncbi:MAG: hypothetical protein HY763_16685 [Planctomycetes bacterium]|nr:hypothetical protein [Planctomycetota bacterium]